MESVEVRVGVDTDNDGKVDQWTDWQEVKETYIPSRWQKSQLGLIYPDYLTTENASKPILDAIRLQF